MSINIIVACDELGSIGYKNTLLYHIREDLQLFKRLTLGNYVVFGRNTYESLPNKPLHKRINVVLTRDKNYRADSGVMIEYDLERIINYYTTTGTQTKDLFICGGEQIYRQALELGCVDKIYLTKIHRQSDKYDTVFPLEYLSEFEIIEEETYWSEEYQCEYSFITYVRKNSDEII